MQAARNLHGVALESLGWTVWRRLAGPGGVDRVDGVDGFVRLWWRTSQFSKRRKRRKRRTKRKKRGLGKGSATAFSPSVQTVAPLIMVYGRICARRFSAQPAPATMAAKICLIHGKIEEALTQGARPTSWTQRAHPKTGLVYFLCPWPFIRVLGFWGLAFRALGADATVKIVSRH